LPVHEARRADTPHKRERARARFLDIRQGY
jgi:hypothetical protein